MHRYVWTYFYSSRDRIIEWSTFLCPFVTHPWLGVLVFVNFRTYDEIIRTTHSQSITTIPFSFCRGLGIMRLNSKLAFMWYNSDSYKYEILHGSWNNRIWWLRHPLQPKTAFSRIFICKFLLKNVILKHFRQKDDIKWLKYVQFNKKYNTHGLR